MIKEFEDELNASIRVAGIVGEEKEPSHEVHPGMGSDRMSKRFIDKMDLGNKGFDKPISRNITNEFFKQMVFETAQSISGDEDVHVEQREFKRTTSTGERDVCDLHLTFSDGSYCIISNVCHLIPESEIEIRGEGRAV